MEGKNKVDKEGIKVTIEGHIDHVGTYPKDNQTVVGF